MAPFTATVHPTRTASRANKMDEGIRKEYKQAMAKLMDITRDRMHNSVDPLDPKDYEAALAIACDMEKNARDIYGNGDQSPLLFQASLFKRSTDLNENMKLIKSQPAYHRAQNLRTFWSTGGDFGPENLMMTNKFRWACLVGHVNLVETCLNMAKKQDGLLFAFLETRETALRMSALMTAVCGSRLIPGAPSFQAGRIPPEVVKIADHVRVVLLLLDAKASLDAKDVAGYSLMHHCTTSMASSRSLEVGLLLAEHGADPNLYNRFGDPPLSDAVLSGNLAAVTMLLEAGADPHRPSQADPRITPFRLACCSPDILEALSAATSRAAACGSHRLAGRRVRLTSLAASPELNGRVGLCDATLGPGATVVSVMCDTGMKYLARYGDLAD